MTSPVAKISRPKVTGVIQRERLFQHLDGALQKPVAWISSPGGSGKTTLVSSYLDSRKLPCLWYQVDERDADIATFFYYIGMAAKALTPQKSPLPLLTPEYLQNIPVFTRNYFDMLYNSMKRIAGRRQLLMVLDNYQEAPEDSHLHDVMNHALDIVPPWMRIVVVSRRYQPRQLARQLANNRISNVGWEDLKFTRDEFGKMVKTGQKQVSAGLIDDLYNRTDGWAAGLVLMMDQIRKGGGAKRESVQITPDTIFDYFANEAFTNIESATQTFLLQTSLLPKMTASMAERLTGNNMANEILSGFCRDNYFTQKHRQPVAVYQYHPLFREFLLSRITGAFPSGQLVDLQRNAALLLEEDEQKEDAAELLCSARDNEALVQFILRHAESLISQGRHAVLREWIGRLPGEMFDIQPYLAFWLGQALMAVNPPGSQDCFSRSFSLFKEMRDRTGMLLSWASVVNTARYIGKYAVLDRWIPEIEDILKEDPTFPSPLIETMVEMSMFNALAARQPHHPDMAALNEKAFAVFMQKDSDIAFTLVEGSHLVFHNLWLGNLDKTTVAVNKLRETQHISEGMSTVLVAGGLVSIALYELVMGNSRECVELAGKVLRLSDKTGVHVWDCHVLDAAISSALSDGDMETARMLIGRFEERFDYARLFDRGWYYMNLAWKHVIEGKLAVALEIQRIGVGMLDEVGFRSGEVMAYVMVSDILHEAGEKEESAEYLEKAYAVARGMKSRYFEWMCLLLEARISLDEGNEEQGLECLREGLALGREGGFMNFIGWRRPVMTRLCMKALEAGIETGYVRELIRMRNLVPEAPPLEIEDWPWPLRISTMGGFSVERDGVVLSTTGGAQKKPFNILRALIAFGGDNVREEDLTDALWPEAEGDAAHSAFTTTLSRLRKLIGEDAVIVKGGRVSLNDRFCRVDVWAFERIFKQTQRGGLSPERIRLADKAVALYKGHFLPGEAGQTWTLSMRERLRGKFLRLIAELGGYNQQKGLWKEAVECYLRGLEIDDLSEEFYQGLMLCYCSLGLTGEALSAYDRCGRALTAAFGTGPSFRTKDIYKKVTSKK